MMMNANEASDTNAGKGIHDPDESREGEKDKPGSEKSRKENVEQARI